MKKFFHLLLFVVFLTNSAISADAAGTKYNFTVGTGILSGDTTYRIGGTSTWPNGYSYDYNFPLSELKFPLDVEMVSLGSSMEMEGWNVRIEVKKNITEDAGKMEDSDWGIWYEYGYDTDRNSLDIYSESDAELDAWIVDIKFQFDFFKNSSWSAFMNYGYTYENFYYDVYDVDQWYPSYEEYFGTDAGHDIVNGKVLTYDVTYHIPYIGIGTRYSLKDIFSIEPAIGFSPYVYIRDEDNHLLRDKISEGKLKGTAMMLSLEGRINFTSFLFTTLSVSYTAIEAEGIQRQSTGGEETGTIEQKIESNQTLAMIKMGYSF